MLITVVLDLTVMTRVTYCFKSFLELHALVKHAVVNTPT